MHWRDKNGFVLAVLLSVLSVLGFLAGTIFVLSASDLSLAAGAFGYQRDRTEAESAVWETLAGLEPADLLELSIEAPGLVRAGDGVEVVRLQDNLFVILSGQVRGLRHPVGRFLSIEPPDVPLGRGVVSADGLPLPSAISETSDSSCDVGLDSIHSPDPVAPEWARWESRVSKTLSTSRIAPSPTHAGGACLISMTSNWGDPLDHGSPCRNYRPVIHVGSNLLVQGGVGQGVLLVDGDLTITGPFEFEGLIIATGGLAFGGSVRVAGAVVAGSVGIRDEFLHARLEVLASPCRLRRFLLEFGHIAGLPDPAWFAGS